MRRRYRQDPKTLEMVEITNDTPSRGLIIMGDIEPFVSTVDGSVVSGRAALRAHNKRNNVTNPADFKDEWAKARERREAFFKGDPKIDQARRIEAIKHAVEKHTRRK